MWRPDVTGASSPVEALYEAEGKAGLDRARSLLSADVDPLGTFRRAVDRSDESGLGGRSSTCTSGTTTPPASS